MFGGEGYGVQPWSNGVSISRSRTFQVTVDETGSKIFRGTGERHWPGNGAVRDGGTLTRTSVRTTDFRSLGATSHSQARGQQISENI